MPAVSDGGRTYTFVVRPGFRFAPPSNEPVTARTFVGTIERSADPRIGAPAAGVLADVVGMHAVATVQQVVEALTPITRQPVGEILA